MALLEKRSHWYWQVPEVYNRISIWQPILSLLLRATDKKKTHSFFSLTPNCSKERVYTNQTNNSKLVSKVKIIFTILSKEVNKNPQIDNSISAVSNIQKMWIKRFYRNQWCNDTKEQRHVQTKRESNVRSKKKKHKRSRNLINNKPEIGSNLIQTSWKEQSSSAKKKGGECRFSLLLERES